MDFEGHDEHDWLHAPVKGCEECRLRYEEFRRRYRCFGDGTSKLRAAQLTKRPRDPVDEDA